MGVKVKHESDFDPSELHKAMDFANEWVHVQHPLKSYEEYEVNVDEIIKRFINYGSKIISLLNHHTIRLIDGNLIACYMQSKEDGNPRAVYLKQAKH